MLYDVFAGFVVWIRHVCKFSKYFRIYYNFASFAIISYNLDIIHDDMVEDVVEDVVNDVVEVNLINHT